MSLLEGASTAQNAEKETDRLGGFQLLESDVHLMEIEVAYLHTSTSGARAVTIHAKNEQGNLRTTQYFMSGKAKDFKTYYVKDGKEFNLPGFTIVNDIFLAITGKGMEAADIEDKVIKLYDRDAGGEVPTPVKMIMNLIGQKVALGIVRQIVDKTAIGGDNKYHPTGETREENELVKVFTTEGLTLPEVAAGITEPSFIVGWKEKYQGEVLNKAKGATQNGNSGAPAAAGTTKKLFK